MPPLRYDLTQCNRSPCPGDAVLKVDLGPRGRFGVIALPFAVCESCASQLNAVEILERFGDADASAKRLADVFGQAYAASELALTFRPIR